MKALLVFSLLFALSACGGGAPPQGAPDADGDGIPDAADLCPATPETPNGYQDEDGCPDASTAHGPMPAAVFGTWTGTLSVASLGTSVTASAQYPGYTVTLAPAADSMAAMAAVCPDGSGAATLAWVDDAASWYGIVLCPDTRMNGCIVSDLAIYLVRVRVDADGILRMTSSGTMRSKTSVEPSCAASGDVTMTLAGQRQ